MAGHQAIELERSVGYGSFISVKNIKIHVWEAGEGYPLILIHGFTGTAYDWRFNIPELAKNFSVHAFDLPGFGYSQKPLDFKYNADGYADFVIDFMDERGIDKAVLVGNSLGGHVALNTCARYAKRVSGLVLVDSGGYPASKKFLLFNLMTRPVLGKLMMQLNSRNTIRQALKNTILFNSAFATEDVISDYYNVYSTPNARKIPPVVVRNMTADESRTPEILKLIQSPTLIIWGEQDKVIPLCWGECFHRDINNSSLVIIPESGHMPQIEQSETVNKAIASFVTSII
jgi:pimeloyl-ACP methyl ester carboxylesterase